MAQTPFLLPKASLESGATHNDTSNDTSKYPQVLSFLGDREYKVRRYDNRAIIDFVPPDPKMSSSDSAGRRK